MNTMAAEILNAFTDALDLHNSNPEFIQAKHQAQIYNPWFTQESIENSLVGWQHALKADSREKWLQALPISPEKKTQTLGIIGAGNIPCVIMHDVISACISGYPLVLKLSSDDAILPKIWLQLTEEILSESLNITYADQLKTVDRVIATGSNNTHRYFEYYFRDKPNILRKNRHSVAVLPQGETLSESQIMGLGSDIFAYFGMGCRNVTQVFLPRNFDFARIFPLWETKFGDLVNHHKYVNNYHYHKALLLMNLDPHIDAGFVLFKERNTLHAPVGLVNYTYYDAIEEVQSYLTEHQEEIQCIVSEGTEVIGLPFGTAQKPELWDYADGVDTLKWLNTVD